MDTFNMGLLGYSLIFVLLSLAITIGLGRYMAAVFDHQPLWPDRFLKSVETFLLKMIGISGSESMTWQHYAQALLSSNFIAGLLAFFIVRYQNLLPINPLKLAGIEPMLAFNMVCSFVTNTNWQSYSGEVALSNLSQMFALTFWMVLGATSGLVVCIAFLRGLSQRPIGNYYQDFIRALLYIFFPILVVGGLFFISQGVPQTLNQQVIAKTIEGPVQKIALGPVASLLTIKQLGTNGGGFFNANSAHPFENPNPLTNLVELLMELAIPMALVYQFGVWLKDKKQGWMIWGSMMGIVLLFFIVANHFEQSGNPLLTPFHMDQVASPFQSGGNMEGKEVRFGIIPSILFTTVTTATSTGAVNNMHDSLTPIAGLIPILNMMLNVLFGGVGVGLMNFLLYAIIAVFLTGLMVGRTPEIFGKKIDKSEIILASIAILLHPLLILLPTAISAVSGFGLSSLNNLGPHGLSEILYAYTSAAANNGSAFSGLNANTSWYNMSIGIVILLGRYISIIALLAIAGSLLSKHNLEPGPGTLRTNTPLFAMVLVGVILIISALTFVPVLALGPVAEHMAMLARQVY